MACLLAEDGIIMGQVVQVKTCIGHKNLFNKSNGILGIFSPNSEIIGAAASTLTAAAAITGDRGANILLCKEVLQMLEVSHGSLMNRYDIITCCERTLACRLYTMKIHHFSTGE
jgi:hypothetical protein